MINKPLGWNGFNILHREASRVGALDLGLPQKALNLSKSKFIYILGCDNIRPQDIPEDAFVVY